MEKRRGALCLAALALVAGLTGCGPASEAEVDLGESATLEDEGTTAEALLGEEALFTAQSSAEPLYVSFEVGGVRCVRGDAIVEVYLRRPGQPFGTTPAATAHGGAGRDAASFPATLIPAGMTVGGIKVSVKADVAADKCELGFGQWVISPSPSPGRFTQGVVFRVWPEHAPYTQPKKVACNRAWTRPATYGTDFREKDVTFRTAHFGGSYDGETGCTAYGNHQGNADWIGAFTDHSVVSLAGVRTK